MSTWLLRTPDEQNVTANLCIPRGRFVSPWLNRIALSDDGASHCRDDRPDTALAAGLRAYWDRQARMLLEQGRLDETTILIHADLVADSLLHSLTRSRGREPEAVGARASLRTCHRQLMSGSADALRPGNGAVAQLGRTSILGVYTATALSVYTLTLQLTGLELQLLVDNPWAMNALKNAVDCVFPVNTDFEIDLSVQTPASDFVLGLVPSADQSPVDPPLARLGLTTRLNPTGCGQKVRSHESVDPADCH